MSTVKRKKVFANEEAEVVVAPEVTELLFETEDVAELVAEITGKDVEVEADEDSISFTVGDSVYTVEADGDEEIVETSRKAPKSAKAIAARTITRNARNNAVQANKQSRVIRRYPNKK